MRVGNVIGREAASPGSQNSKKWDKWFVPPISLRGIIVPEPWDNGIRGDPHRAKYFCTLFINGEEGARAGWRAVNFGRHIPTPLGQSHPKVPAVSKA
jgi:hypothetical protein